MKRKVLLCGTHPMQFNGYSKVVFELSNELAKYEDIDLHVFGFQNFYAEKEHSEERKLPDNVTIFDPFAEEEKGGKGFGDKIIKDYVLDLSPDIVILYNDVIVVSSLIKQLVTIKDRKFKIVPYIDLVYQNEKKQLLDYIHAESDSIIAFTDYWKKELIRQDYGKKIYILNHAFNKDNYFPIPKSIARKYFDIDPKDFIILNLNRNQPRKRWDICIQAYIKFLSKHKGDRIKLLVMTNVIGCWDLIELMKFEGKKYGFDLKDLKSYFTFVQNPQKISDAEINVMYNVADIGWNTCDGEGFGLCNFEQAGVGVPQVIPRVGGFRDFFTDENSQLVEPVVGIYGDSTKDACGGMQEICSVDAHVDALEKYYSSRDLIKAHGKRARADILKYTWKHQGSVLRDLILEQTDDLYSEESSSDLLDSINKMLDANEEEQQAAQQNYESGSGELNIDIDALINEKIKEKTAKESITKQAEIESRNTQEKQSINQKSPELRPNLTEELDNLSPNDLIRMQQKIQHILNKKNNSMIE